MEHLERKMKVLELFSGYQGWSKIWEENHHNVLTLDIDKKFNANFQIDILKIKDLKFLEKYGKFDVIFASPPCTTFSVASFPQHNYKNLIPITEKGKIGLKIAKHTFKLIENYSPRYWLVENPRGLLRKFFPENYTTIAYCQYGFKIMKPTDLWNNFGYIGKMCKNGNPDHIASPRGTKRGTQGIFDKNRGGTASKRSMIPPMLAKDIFNFIIEHETEK